LTEERDVVRELAVNDDLQQSLQPYEEFAPATQNMMAGLMRQVVLVNRVDGLLKQVGKPESPAFLLSTALSLP
jgi:hypothetical protein